MKHWREDLNYSAATLQPDPRADLCAVESEPHATFPLNKLERYVIRAADWRGGRQRTLVQERQRFNAGIGEWQRVATFNISLRHFRAVHGAMVKFGELLQARAAGPLEGRELPARDDRLDRPEAK